MTTPTPTLDAGPCVLRAFRPGDAPDLARAGDHRALWRNLTDRFPHPYTLRDANSWIAHARERWPQHWAITVDDRVVGGIGCDPFTDIERFCAEFGYWLAPEQQGRGLATAAVTAFAPFAARAFELRRLQAHVKAWNPASMRVLDKCGFTRELVKRRAAYKDDAFVDLVLYGRLFP